MTGLDLATTNERNQIVAGVTNVLPNLDLIQGNFLDIQEAFNALNSQVQTLAAGGSVQNAAELLVSKANFDKLLALFTGTQAQELFDFIDELNLTANIAAIPTFIGSLIGFTSDIQLALDSVITVDYTLTQPSEFTQLRYVINGIEIEQDLPLQALVSGQVVSVPLSDRNQITAAVVNGEVVSFLRGTLSDGRTLTSSAITVTEGVPPQTPFLYVVLTDLQGIAASLLDARIEIPAPSNKVTFTTPPAGPPPTGGDGGQYAQFYYPDSLQLVSLVNVPIGVDEINSWPDIGIVDINGVSYAAREAGPLVQGATFTYEATFR